MLVTGIKCPRCKKVIYPKQVNSPVLCPCSYCYIEWIFKGKANHARIGYGLFGKKVALVPEYVKVDTETGEVLE